MMKPNQKQIENQIRDNEIKILNALKVLYQNISQTDYTKGLLEKIDGRLKELDF